MRELPAGMRAKIVHHRYVEGMLPGLYTDQQIRSNGGVREPKGGMTEAVIVDVDGNPIVVGTGPDGEPLVAEAAAYCSTADNYNRTIGRDIAVGRALKVLGVKPLRGV